MSRRGWLTCPRCGRKVIIPERGTGRPWWWVGFLPIEEIAAGARVLDGQPTSGRLSDVRVACPRGHQSSVSDLFERTAANAREREARERFGDLPTDDLARRAESLRKAFYARLALKSAQARRAKGTRRQQDAQAQT